MEPRPPGAAGAFLVSPGDPKHEAALDLAIDPAQKSMRGVVERPD